GLPGSRWGSLRTEGEGEQLDDASEGESRRPRERGGAARNLELTHDAARVPLGVTRWQRDLSDSPIKRMMGQALGHSLVACKRVTSSPASMSVDRKRMAEDVSNHREVLAEAVQLLLRLDGNEKGYEQVRKAVENGKFSIPEKYAAKIGEYLGFASDLAG